MFVIQFYSSPPHLSFQRTGNRIASFNKKHYLCRVPPFIFGVTGHPPPLLSLTIY